MSKIFNCELISTQLGDMMSIASDECLYFLDFLERCKFESKLTKFKKFHNCILKQESNKIIQNTKKELKAYFNGDLKKFNIPLHTTGSIFQKNAWDKLLLIPYAETKSYYEQAMAVGNEKAYRAVANANAANTLAIVVPCHRVINKNYNLGGYASGLDRKKWLLEHELRNK